MTKLTDMKKWCVTIVLMYFGSGVSEYSQLEGSVAVLPKFIFEVFATKLLTA